MILEYNFSDKTLFKRALTHKSAGTDNNERLEFLGDAIVNWIIAEALYLKFPEATEGDLSRLRAQLVKQASLADLARALCLGEQLILGSGELKSGGYRRDSILSDALEALIAAVYFDSGDINVCKKEVLRWFAEKLDKQSLDQEYRDYKTQLQEWLQSRHLPLPVYEVLEETGADNERLFKMSCAVKKLKVSVTAEGDSKKQAEQKAAALLLDKLLDQPTVKKQKGSTNE